MHFLTINEHGVLASVGGCVLLSKTTGVIVAISIARLATPTLLLKRSIVLCSGFRLNPNFNKR